MLILFLLQGWGRWLWKWVGLKIDIFIFFFQSESNAAKTATEKHDYSIFVYRIVTLHDVFIMCNIFCSKHTWGRDMLMGGLWSWRWGWGGGSLPKANRNAIDKCFSSKLESNQQRLTVEAEFDNMSCWIWETERRKWVGGSFGKPTTGNLGTLQTTLRSTVYTLRYCTTEGFLQHLGL